MLKMSKHTLYLMQYPFLFTKIINYKSQPARIVERKWERIESNKVLVDICNC